MYKLLISSFVLFLIIFFSLPESVRAITHRIGTRVGSGGPEFYDTATGAKFTPRGNNYVLLSSGHTHIQFDPGLYNATNMENLLTQMQHDGYNTVRFFLSMWTVGSPTGGMSDGFISNFVDFMGRAKNHGIYIIPIFENLPQAGGYIPSDTNPNIESANAYYLQQSYIEAKKKYLQDFIRSVKSKASDTTPILAYQLENEVAFYKNQKPFSLTSGVVTTAAGNYDMGVPDQRRQAMDANLVYWSNVITDAIKAVDSQALVTVGFFTPTADTATRTFRTYWMFRTKAEGGSSIDFLDLHPYPWMGSIQNQIGAYEIGNTKKPFIMGEFGISKSQTSNITQAALLLRDWQIASCQYGFKGWLLWGWGQPAINWTGFYATEENGGTINGVLAPITRPDPCSVNSATPRPQTPTPPIRTPSASSKTGDINMDGSVNIIDIGVVIDNYGRSPIPNPKADINNDGLVNIIDIGIVIDNYGR